eukprot:scaffold3260_cov212-Isochrysis_galbana.AAC.12
MENKKEKHPIIAATDTAAGERAVMVEALHVSLARRAVVRRKGRRLSERIRGWAGSRRIEKYAGRIGAHRVDPCE